MKILAAIIMAAGLFFISPAFAMQADDTAAYLCDSCSGSTEDQLFCLGYIRGVINTFDGETEAHMARPVYCLPTNTPVNDIKAVWDRYCGNHQKDHSARASSLLAVALARAYPCTATAAH